MKNIVITGVSTGIGYSTAKILLNNGFRVFGSVRNFKDSKKLKNEFGNNFISLIFDVTNKKDVLNAVKSVES